MRIEEKTALRGLLPGALLRRAADGDMQAFEELCGRILPPLNSFVKGRLRSLNMPCDLAPDTVHDGIIKAIDWLKLHPEASVNWAWLCKVTDHVISDVRRQIAKNRAFSLTQTERLNEARGEKEDATELIEALKSLPHADREILQLVYFDELSAREAATRLRIDKWAAHKRLQRALSRLRAKFLATPKKRLHDLRAFPHIP